MKKTISFPLNRHCLQWAVLMLATAIGVPTFAQTSQPIGASATEVATPTQDAQNSPANASSDAQEPPDSYTDTPVKKPREGFWGRVNPFARKKWVKNQFDPINGQLSELNEVNAKNAHDIKDVDSRAQAGIFKAQSTADAANQTATVADAQARQAGTTAQNAMNHVDSLTSTVNSLDTYSQLAEVDVLFRGGQPILSTAARKTLDDLATKVSGQSGYIIEVEAHSPAPGAAGIQNSERLAEAVKRYLVTEHEIPVYRMHAVAMGNASITDEDGNERPIRSSNVRIRLMENSLATQRAASPQDAGNLAGQTAEP